MGNRTTAQEFLQELQGRTRAEIMQMTQEQIDEFNDAAKLHAYTERQKISEITLEEKATVKHIEEETLPKHRFGELGNSTVHQLGLEMDVDQFTFPVYIAELPFTGDHILLGMKSGLYGRSVEGTISTNHITFRIRHPFHNSDPEAKNVEARRDQYVRETQTIVEVINQHIRSYNEAVPQQVVNVIAERRQTLQQWRSNINRMNA